MTYNDETFGEETDEPYERIRSNGLRNSERRKTVRTKDTPFPVQGYGAIQPMAEKIKIPAQRNAYLREAFFKCYFQGISFDEEIYNSREVLRRFAKLFYYHQEIRIETRKLFNRFNTENLKENSFFALKEYLERLVNDGCKTLNNLPSPEIKNYPNRRDFQDEGQWIEACENFVKGTDQVEITFKPKKRDFPKPEEIYTELAGIERSSVKKVKGRSYVHLMEQDHSVNKYLRISNLLWTQSIALIVHDAVEEIEREVSETGVLYDYIHQTTIKAAIEHFNQNHPQAKEMDNNEKAYSISLRYKNKLAETPYKRESIAAYLRRMGK